ncbi:hypothetical protein ACFWJ4_37605 [Kitasatospora sp. NPDC127067]|uniref:hypothetical protein n=1 Tax=Kitasatospora sp. NPDC127067 TaxID=3347126 RepID=UPI00364F4CCB
MAASVSAPAAGQTRPAPAASKMYSGRRSRISGNPAAVTATSKSPCGHNSRPPRRTRACSPWPDASGHDAVDVVQEADNIEALPHETPTLVLGLIDDGAAPHEAVTGLVRHALRITDGLLPDPNALREQLDDLEETLTDYGDDAPDPADVELRLPPLDPKRPAHDLLEDLLTGIRACWLLHTEYDDLNDEDLGDAEDWDDEQAQEHQRHSREPFAQLVCEASAHRDRLIRRFQ